MRDIVQRLISEEHRAEKPTDPPGRAAFRVCEKLRQPLSTFAGKAGFRSLLLRALALAIAEVSWLGELRINMDGSIAFPAEIDSEMDPAETAKGGAILLAHVIELLVTLIGETLTLRLVQDVSPKASLERPEPGDSHEKKI